MFAFLYIHTLKKKKSKFKSVLQKKTKIINLKYIQKKNSFNYRILNQTLFEINV